MDEKTEILICELAEKLGTTGEHLWGVLLTQAPIYAVTAIFTIVSLCIVGIFGFKWSVSRIKKNDDYMFPAIVFAVLLIFTMIAASIEIQGVMAALFNPEYWALMKVINSL